MRLQAAVLSQQFVQHNAKTGIQCSPSEVSAKSQALQIKILPKMITLDTSPQEEKPCCYCQELFYKPQCQVLALLQILALFIIANFPCQRFFGVALRATLADKSLLHQPTRSYCAQQSVFKVPLLQLPHRGRFIFKELSSKACHTIPLNLPD